MIDCCDGIGAGGPCMPSESAPVFLQKPTGSMRPWEHVGGLAVCGLSTSDGIETSGGMGARSVIWHLLYEAVATVERHAVPCLRAKGLHKSRSYGIKSDTLTDMLHEKLPNRRAINLLKERYGHR